MTKKKNCEHGQYVVVKDAHKGIDLTMFKRYISWFCPDCGRRIPEED
jgi:predicted RNA-binding Zn-ribbon protein involved in translation (DUF1610 family)